MKRVAWWKRCSDSNTTHLVPPISTNRIPPVKNASKNLGEEDKNIETKPITSVVPIALESSQAVAIEQVDLSVSRPVPFTEIWHNEEPFLITEVTKLKKSPSCAQFTCLISRNALEPYNITIAHKERYLYPSPEDKGKWIPTRTKMRNEYYCVKKSYLLKRHPYFWLGLLSTAPDIVLNENHRIK